MSERPRSIPAHLEDLLSPAARRADPSPAPESGPDRPPRPLPVGIPSPSNPRVLQRLLAATPARIGTGRAGARYRTDTYLELRADHAIAKDAVYAELPTELGARLGCLEVVSQCENREHYLLHPNHGRRLGAESRALLAAQGTKGADVQVIVADGLSAPALVLNAELLPRLLQELQAKGLSVGKPVLARMARVGLQDDIGVLLGSRATAICLGERPGLGTGDSLSIYIAVNPKLDQDNAEKNCISNIRPQGLQPAHAAERAAELLRRGIAAGRSGLELS